MVLNSLSQLSNHHHYPTPELFHFVKLLLTFLGVVDSRGLDLTDRVPEEQWMEVHDIVQEVVIKIPKKKKCKKAKWLSNKALQIAVKRSETKRKGEKESIPI